MFCPLSPLLLRVLLCTPFMIFSRALVNIGITTAVLRGNTALLWIVAMRAVMERVGMVNSISTVMVLEVTLMERVGTVKAYQYHGNAGDHNGDKNNDDGEGRDAGATHRYCDMIANMHFDSIVKFYTTIIPAATTSSGVREVNDNMKAYAPRASGKATKVGGGNPTLS